MLALAEKNQAFHIIPSGPYSVCVCVLHLKTVSGYKEVYLGPLYVSPLV